MCACACVCVCVRAGVVSMRGCSLHQDVDVSVLQCPGPITRHARDLTLVLGVMAGQQGGDTLTLGKKVRARITGKKVVLTITGKKVMLRGCYTRRI